jgi:hypothetical protein
MCIAPAAKLCAAVAGLLFRQQMLLAAERDENGMDLQPVAIEVHFLRNE